MSGVTARRVAIRDDLRTMVEAMPGYAAWHAARRLRPGWGAWALIAYKARGEVRYLWNATPLAPPLQLHLCDQGWVWEIDIDHPYPAPLYVPAPGQQIIMHDGERHRVVRADAMLAAIFAERRHRLEADRIVLAPRGTTL